MNEVLSTLKEIVDTDKSLKWVLNGRDVLLDQQLSPGFKQYTAIRQGEYHPGVSRLRVADYDRYSLESMIKLRLDAYNEYQDDAATYLAFILQQLNEPSIFNISMFGPMRVNIEQLRDFSFEDEDLTLKFLEKQSYDCLHPAEINIHMDEFKAGDPLHLDTMLIQFLFMTCRTPFEAYTLAYRIVTKDLYLQYKSSTDHRMAKFRLLHANEVKGLPLAKKFDSVKKGEVFSVYELLRKIETFTSRHDAVLSDHLLEALNRWIYGTKN